METLETASTTHYCCWVRVVDLDKPTSRAPVTRITPGTFQLLYWHVGTGGVVPRPNSTSKGEATGVWSADPEFFGRDGTDTGFDYGPAFLNPDQAREWISDTAEGRLWDREAANRFLMIFSYTPPKGAS